MAYCTAAQVASLNPQRTYSASSKPSLTEIGEFIDRIAAEMDVILQGRSLTVPVTEPAELVTFLEQLNVLGAGSLTEQAMFPAATGAGSSPASGVLWARYREGLEYLKTGVLTTSGSDAPVPFSWGSQQRAQGTEPVDDYTWNRPKFGKNKEF
jgi:hypothetical protein